MNKNRSLKSIFAKLIVIGVTLVISITACGGPTAVPPAVVPTQPPVAVPTMPTRGQGGTLTLLFFQAPTTVNPHLSTGSKDRTAGRIVYEPLATFDRDGSLMPLLAADIPSLENGNLSSDGTSVTWRLKQDVKWADGHPFTAKDVLFTFQYIINPEVKSPNLSTYTNVKAVETPDEYTVKITFKKPTTSWFVPFVGQLGVILPEHLFRDYNGANAMDAPNNLMAVGTGPYLVTDFISEDVLIISGDAVSTNKIIYSMNPYYRDPNKPFFSRLGLHGGGDLESAVKAGKEGAVDFVWNAVVSEDVLIDLESAGKALAIARQTSYVERILFNFTDPNKETVDGERSNLQFPHPILSDIKVRQAIAMAINRETIAAAYGRGGTLTTNILVEPKRYASNVTRYDYDPKKAAELLDQAGWKDTNQDGIREKDGMDLHLVFQTSIQRLRQQTQEQVKKDLKAVGIEVELKQIDSSVFFGSPKSTTNTQPQFYADLEEYAFNNKIPDPIAYMAGWTCDQIAQKSNDWSLSNSSRYCNPSFDELYRQAAAELDETKRSELFVKMNELLIEDVAVIPLVKLSDAVIVSSDLKGYDFTPWDLEIWNIADWHK